MTIHVTDQSTITIPEIAWGKNTLTGDWVVSMNFSDEGFKGEIYED